MNGNDTLALKPCLVQESSSDNDFAGYKAIVLFAAACVYNITS